MRLIHFKRLTGKNFLSFGDKEVTIDLQPGVNAIIGQNHDKEDSKNGAGKSSVTELLYFALYGTTLREIPKDHIQNSITKKRCEVSLEFDVKTSNTVTNYKIVRMLNPTKCSLYKDNEDVTRSTLVKTNELIQQLLRTPAPVFQNSVIMSANNAAPFMALSKTDKRKFIESVLGLEVFTEMVLRSRDEFSIAKKDYEIAYSKFEQIKNELEFNNAQLLNYEKLKQERITKLQEKALSLQKEIQTLSDQYSNVTNEEIRELDQQLILYKEGHKKLTEQQQEVKSKIVKLQIEKENISKQTKQLLTNKDICPTCTREYSSEHIQHVQTLITELQASEQSKSELELKQKDALVKISEKLTNLTVLMSKQEASKKECETKQTNNNKIDTSISFLKKNFEETQDEIKIVCKEQHNNELKGKVSNLQIQEAELNQKVDSLNNQLNVLETVKFVISEEGIKSFIVKKIIKVLNSRLAFYLKKLEANCLCQFNEYFEEQIVDEKNEQKSYFNFSGGERKRIDLACLFAFADIRRLQGDVNFSTVFYDELLDSSLDDKGVHLTLKVLRERFLEINESCYIITHRGMEVTTKAEHIITVAKKHGLSTII